MNAQSSPSPFHAGERYVQERVGARERTEMIGRRVIRDHLLDQHRDFFESLPFALMGTVNEAGQPCASLLAGGPGFVRAPDAQQVRIEAWPVGDATPADLGVGATVGLLGIEYHTRRRNRLNGRIASVDAEGFALRVEQSFGNCPKYIQAREIEWPAEPGWRTRPVSGRAIGSLDGAPRSLVEHADHFYIATSYEESTPGARHGADVSHRGGRPGFVRVSDGGTLSFPDFAGNRHFNTLGNLVRNPKAGLLFIDFDRGDVLSFAGRAEIEWSDESTHGVAGAERLVHFHVDGATLYDAALPVTTRFVDYSPALERTGDWPEPRG